MGTVKCVGILTSGGDAPGMNAAIRAVTRARTAGQYHLWGRNVLRRCASAQALPAQPNSSIFSLHLSTMA